MEKKFFIFLVLLFIIAGCGREDPHVAVEVDDYQLPVAELENAPYPEDYLNDWLEKRLLALEAKERGLQHNREFDLQMQTIETLMLADYLLQTELERLDSISADEIEEYYRTHKEEFLLSAPEVDFIYFMGDNQRELTFAQVELRGGDSEKTVARRHPSLTLSRETLSDPESLEPPFNSFGQRTVGTVFGPLELDGKYYTFMITGQRKSGDYQPLDNVKEDIHQRILNEKLYEYKQKLLKDLRARYKLKFNDEALAEVGITIGDEE